MDRSEITAKAKLRVERARARSGLVDVLLRTFKRYSDDDGGPLAAALTYYTFFSIFPLLLFAASILGFLTLGNEELRRDLLGKSVDAIPLIRDALQPAGLELIEERRGSLALTGFALAIYSGTGAVLALQHALNRIRRVTHERTFLQKRLRALMMLAVVGSASLLSIGVSALGSIVGQAGGGDAGAVVLATAGGMVVSFLIFLAAFTLLPADKVPWREAAPGAALAALLFEVLKVTGTWYLARGETTRNDTFGTFAAAAALLVACYLISQMTLLAAEMNAALAERKASRQSASIAEQEET